MRHSFASGLVAKNVHLATIQRLMSHSSISMTEVYLHISNELKTEAVAAGDRTWQRPEVIGPEALDVDLAAAAASPGPDGAEMTLEELEREYIRRILRRARGHTGRAAAILGINRKTLWEKRRRYGLP